MEKIIIYIFIKYKIFFYGVMTGGILQYFEIQVGNSTFNIGKFIISTIVFGFLTQFSNLLIEGQFISTDTSNESRVVVLSIMIASLLYLFVPFVLRKDNRGKFIESILSRFGFYKDKE